MMVVSTPTMSPTKPMSSPFEYFFTHFRRFPSLPEIPTALPPRLLMSCTRDLLTLFSTISAISMVSSSVTRSPFTKCGSIPTLLIHFEISLPPPWTMIGFRPTSFRIATSCMTCFFRFSSVIADPPYFTTTTLS